MSHEFTVTGSEVVLDAPIIAVRRDQVVMPGGNEAAREIVEHFGAVAPALAATTRVPEPAGVLLAAFAALLPRRRRE